MKLPFKILAIIVLSIVACNALNAQEQSRNNVVDYKNQKPKLIDYEFNGELTETQHRALESEIQQMKFVTNAKVILKSEKKTGIARVQVKEFYTNKDTDFEFDIYKLKMLLTKFGLTPAEHRIQEISNN